MAAKVSSSRSATETRVTTAPNVPSSGSTFMPSPMVASTRRAYPRTYDRIMNGDRRRMVLGVLVVGTIVIAGCGDDGDDSSDTNATEPVVSTADTAEPAGSFPDWPRPDDTAAVADAAGVPLMV